MTPAIDDDNDNALAVLRLNMCVAGLSLVAFTDGSTEQGSHHKFTLKRSFLVLVDVFAASLSIAEERR